MYKRIIVPLDGSALAEEALDQARNLATTMNIPLHVIRVVDTYRAQVVPATGMALDYSMLAELAEEELDDARSYIKEQIAKLSDEVTGEVPHGPIAQQIVNSAREGDVIVMSSHGRTGIQRWFLGSVAEEVMRRANCPVLLHRDSRATKADDQ